MNVLAYLKKCLQDAFDGVKWPTCQLGHLTNNNKDIPPSWYSTLLFSHFSHNVRLFSSVTTISFRPTICNVGKVLGNGKRCERSGSLGTGRKPPTEIRNLGGIREGWGGNEGWAF